MSGPQCWHPFDGEVTADTEYCRDCGEPLDDGLPEQELANARSEEGTK